VDIPDGQRLAVRRIVAVTAALAVLAALPAAVHAAGRSVGVTTPATDSFYRAPNPLPPGPPGTILRSRPVSLTALGLPLPLQAWQIMYVSTDVASRPAAVVATIIKPINAASSRLLSYQEPWDSDSLSCAPSYQLRAGNDINAAALLPALAAGWTVVDSDFEGLQSAYTAGIQAAHGVLDGIRAAERFAPAHLSAQNTPVGLWGYSGGAQATAWATELAATYAPELKIVGAAEGGVPANVNDIATHLDGGPSSGIELAGAVGLSRAYPELATLWNAAGKTMAATIGNECIGQYAIQYAFQRMDTYTTVSHARDMPWVKAIIDAQSLGQRRPAAPLYVYQSINDELIPGADVNALVSKYCRQGVSVFYYQDPASEHISLAVTGAPAAFAYLAARFAHQPVPTTCGVPQVPPS
jgi:hypothetical protein